jgi:L-asparaginase
LQKIRILPIHAGGTIASIFTETGFRPELSFADLLRRADGKLVGDRIIASALSPLGEFGVDSASMQIHHIQKIAKAICDSYDQHDAFIITHGTDTLAYTASMLSFMLQGIQKPVIVTGAQKTLEDENCDVIGNLETTLLAASTFNCGVWVAFNKKIINAVRATKIDIGVENTDAFVSNLRDEIDISDFLLNDYAINRGQTETFSTQASEELEIFCLSHTTKPSCLGHYLGHSDLKALIVLIYGMSGHREELVDILSRWADNNGAIVIAKTHSPFGSTDLSKYELGIKALRSGLLSSLDMTLESIFAKTSLLLAQGGEQKEFNNLFYTNFCGELDETHARDYMSKAKSWIVG